MGLESLILAHFVYFIKGDKVKKTFKILAIILVAFGFVACDEVSKAVKQIGASPSNNAKELQKIANSGVSSTNATTNSGDSSVADSSNTAQSNSDGSGVKAIASDSICKISTDISAYANDYGRTIDGIREDSGGGNKQYWTNELIRYYGGEIKKSDKETICLAVPMFSIDYLATDLTPQEIERFERFLLEKEADDYRHYESNKAECLNALKFLKHYNKLDGWYSAIIASGGDMIVKRLTYIANDLNWVSGLNGKPIITAKKFVYGKDTGGALQVYSDDERAFYSFREIGGSCYREETHTNHKECQAIIKWIKSIQKQYQ